MPDFILLMHDDAAGEHTPAMWTAYLAVLNSRGAFEGGSSIGGGLALRKQAPAAGVSEHLSGYIRIKAANIAEATDLLAGNPIYECGGTVEIRELPRN